MPRYKGPKIQQRWPFRHKLKNGKVLTFWMKAIPAKRHAHPELDAKHVRESIRREGVGDTQNCTEACMVQDNAKEFDHPVEGTVDFGYRRVAVVSQLYKEPRRLNRNTKRIVWGECVIYEHRHANIAKLNDSPKGQQKLLEMLEANGPMRQTFSPLPVLAKRTWQAPKTGKRTGSRTRFKRGKARASFAGQAFAVPSR